MGMGMPPGPPLPMPMGPPVPMDPAMGGMPGMVPPAMGGMDEGGPVPPPTATPLGGAGAGNNMAVDQDAMGMAPTPAPGEDDMIMSALRAVLGKWASGGATIAGEKNSLLQTLMMLASSKPPMPQEAFVEGGSPTNFGMIPQEEEYPMEGSFGSGMPSGDGTY